MEHQPEPTLVEFIRYNAWANQQVLAACQNASQSQLVAKVPGTYGCILEIVGHLVAAEADYLNRITGAGPQPPFRWEDGPSLADMTAFAAQVNAAFLDLVERVPPTQIVREEEDGKFIEYQARQLFMQAVNHGIEHRTNITTFLHSQGLPVPEVDNWGYLFAHPQSFALQEGDVAAGD
jgi:uncharacterized damage-inducible protein DinB